MSVSEEPPLFGYSKDLGSMALKVAGYIPFVGLIAGLSRAILFANKKTAQPTSDDGKLTALRCALEMLPVVNTISLPIIDIVTSAKRYYEEKKKVARPASLAQMEKAVAGMILKGDYEKAVPVLLEMIQLGENSAHSLLGSAYMNQGTKFYDLKQAYEEFNALSDKGLAIKQLQELQTFCEKSTVSERDLAARCRARIAELTVDSTFETIPLNE